MPTVRKTIKRNARRGAVREFLGDKALLKRNGVTAEEVTILKDFSPLGVLTGSADLLFILETIRWARDKHSAA